MPWLLLQDRTDRELVTPWFKFLWETYRSVLDNLRNNARLEALYAMTATKAFQFCLTYKRTTEFRRLCDILRNHLANLNKSAPPLLKATVRCEAPCCRFAACLHRPSCPLLCTRHTPLHLGDAS